MEGLLYLVFLLLLQGGSWGSYAKDEQHESNQPPELSIVKRAAKDPFSRRSSMDKNFIRFGRSGDYFHEVPDRTRQKNLMSFARVSRAAKDNFMRFGRPEKELQQLYLAPTVESSAPNRRGDNFMRFGRAKDNFMRFGRKDNFMRFGRGKDNFMRFGRNFLRFGKSKDNFMRFGRKDNFMRFGRGKDNFMRFGRKDNFMRFGRDPIDIFDEENEIPTNDFLDKKGEKTIFVRFGKSPKNEDGFIRFGRGEQAEDPDEHKIDDDGPEVDRGDLDLQGDKPKNGPVIRIKRETPATSLWEVEANSMGRASRDYEIMEDIPQLTAQPEKGAKSVQKRYVQPQIIYDPESFSFESDLGPVELDPSSEVYYRDDKQNNGGSGYIRFGSF